MRPTLTLAFGNLSLILGDRYLSPFTSTNYPRIRESGPSFTRSLSGSVIASALSYESPHLWPVGVRLTQLNAAKLEQMYSLWLLTRPLTYLTLEDRVQRIYEPGLTAGNRTRALVGGTTAILDSNGLNYLARFNTTFFDTPEFSADGAWVRCQFQLIEGAKTTP